MAGTFWFNRMVEYWTIPLPIDLPQLVRRNKLQLVQTGTFGPMFYSLADDPAVDRSWVGMPLVGIEENLALAARLIPAIQQAGAKFVGQMSMAWNYGDHETGKGLWQVWDRLWTADLLGPAPCSEPGEMMERVAGGALRCWPIEGRPYRTYSGCYCNPNWLAALKAMIRRAIELGVDGFQVHHNFTSFCRCGHCRTWLQPAMAAAFSGEELRQLFGSAELEGVADLIEPQATASAALRARWSLQLNRWAQQRRKDAYDELYIAYGRSLKPDLLLSQWYHKYDFGPGDERSLLPRESWARDEDYIWYSQGPWKGISRVEQGYLTDTGLAARFIHAAGKGRPFICNKYDHRRLRLSIAEAAANHAAALAFHVPWAAAGGDQTAIEEYQSTTARYHGFLAEHDDLIHPADTWAQVGLVYPRRGELESEGDCLDVLKRLGRLLEDGHWAFDILLEEQLLERGGRYQVLVVPEIRRLSVEERQWLLAFRQQGGLLVLAGRNGVLNPDNEPAQPLAADWPTALRQGILALPDGPWGAAEVELGPGMRSRTYPVPEQDAWGRRFLADLAALAGPSWFRTDAPWYVRVRTWRPQARPALVVHWVNYLQDEQAALEVPRPVGPLAAVCRVPEGFQVTGVEWRYPEMGAPAALPWVRSGADVCFTVPRVIHYGLSVIHLEPV